MSQDIKVRVFKCKCGDARMLSVIPPNGEKYSKENLKAQEELLKVGLEIETVPLEVARTLELCFDCDLGLE